MFGLPSRHIDGGGGERVSGLTIAKLYQTNGIAVGQIEVGHLLDVLFL